MALRSARLKVMPLNAARLNYVMTPARGKTSFVQFSVGEAPASGRISFIRAQSEILPASGLVSQIYAGLPGPPPGGEDFEEQGRFRTRR